MSISFETFSSSAIAAVKEKNKGQIKRVFVQTFGCQQNEADSEKLAGMAKEMGYDLTGTPEDADLIAVNTCAILTARYPQIRQIVVITSDYHMPLGCMLFDEASLLHAWKTGGDAPYTVVPGPSWATSGSAEYSGHRNIMSYVWIMAQKEM